MLLTRTPGPLDATADELRDRDVQARGHGGLDRCEFDGASRLGHRRSGGGAAELQRWREHEPRTVPGQRPRQYSACIDLYITSPLALCRHIGTPMCERKRGRIILVGSLAGYMGQPEISIYSGTTAFGRIFAEGCGWNYARSQCSS